MDVNEAISAVADEGFLGEEEDDDYEDLYNDVNVGENFFHSLRKKDAIGMTAAAEKKADPAPAPAPALPPLERRVERIEEEGLGARVQVGYQSNLGYRGPGEHGVPGGLGGGGGGGGGFRVELGQASGSNAPNQPMIHPQLNLVGNAGNDVMMRQVSVNINGPSASVNVNMNAGSSTGGVGGGNGAILFVGELHWWTTDAELEIELSKYGPVIEV